MNRMDDRRLAEALEQGASIREQRQALHMAAIRRWLASNPGEALADCVRATGAPEAMVRRVAKEVGHGGLKRYPVVRRFKAAVEAVRR